MSASTRAALSRPWPGQERLVLFMVTDPSATALAGYRAPRSPLPGPGQTLDGGLSHRIRQCPRYRPPRWYEDTSTMAPGRLRGQQAADRGHAADHDRFEVDGDEVQHRSGKFGDLVADLTASRAGSPDHSVYADYSRVLDSSARWPSRERRRPGALTGGRCAADMA